MSGKKIFQIDPENWPNQTTRERVVSERGRKELPPGTKGGENLKPDRHYEHKQYAFDSYCKRSIKNEAMNAYTQLLSLVGSEMCIRDRYMTATRGNTRPSLWEGP